MGHIVEEVALNRGHRIVSIIDVDNRADIAGAAFHSADVAIEFSIPSAGLANVTDAMAQGVPVVSGTTGWLDDAAETVVADFCRRGGRLLHATNFSLGVNVTMAASRLIARLLAPYDEYQASISEVHHIHKLDHPSGTAITLASELMKAAPRYKEWKESTPPAPGILPVNVRREGEVPGFHEVVWDGPDDTITLAHNAKSRHGFATGAVVAAEWLASAAPGHRYSMLDVLGL